MKKIFCFFLIGIFSLPLAGQRNADYGVFAGVSSYIGDLNPSRLMYSPLPAGGFFYRYNLNPRQAIRTSFLVGGLMASGFSFQKSQTVSFSGTVSEWSTQFEFNFFPYSTQGKRWNGTPYIAAGAGIVFINTVVFTYQPVIPFSLGFKINIYKNLGLEVEYGFRKTFYDNFDGLKDFIAPSDYSWYHNNDWYSFAGFSFTWKIYNRLAGCPAFNDVDTRKKH